MTSGPGLRNTYLSKGQEERSEKDDEEGAVEEEQSLGEGRARQVVIEAVLDHLGPSVARVLLRQVRLFDDAVLVPKEVGLPQRSRASSGISERSPTMDRRLAMHHHAARADTRLPPDTTQPRRSIDTSPRGPLAQRQTQRGTRRRSTASRSRELRASVSSHPVANPPQLFCPRHPSGGAG